MQQDPEQDLGQDLGQDPWGAEVDHLESTASGDPTSGHPTVDAVLGSLEDLGDRPVDEHVEVFEQAHAQLRALLSASPVAAQDPPRVVPPTVGRPGPRPGPT